MATKRGKPKRGTKHGSPKDRWAFLAVLFKGLLALSVVLGVMVVIVWIGGRAGQQVTSQNRYAVRFTDIATDVPPGTDKLTFLTEVRFLDHWPEAVQVVEPTLKDRLAATFAKHPWVSEVTAVAIGADASIHVALKFRVPVLQINVRGEVEPRTVDRHAVILPPAQHPATLPMLVNPQLAPKLQAGLIWPDDTVKRAADLAYTYKPKRIEKTDKGWRLTQADDKVLIVGW